MEFTSIYLSRILNNKVYTKDNKVIGTLKDLGVSLESANPKVMVAKVKNKKGIVCIKWEHISISKVRGQYNLVCSKIEAKPLEGYMLLKRYVFDKQIIDVNGRKVVRVNDIRMVSLSSGFFVVAVDIGMDGLLRRIGLAKPLKKVGFNLSSKLMLWNDVQTISNSLDLKLSKTYNKLTTLHASDLADIIEDFDTNTGMILFSSLDNAKAADVLEELEESAQIKLLSKLPVEKAADILEEMPADEVANILDGLNSETVEELLSNMEKDASDEVRELMEYDDKEIGSLMSTDYLFYTGEKTIEYVIENIREIKPEHEEIHYIYVIDVENKLRGTVSLRDVIVSEPALRLEVIMNKDFIYMQDTDKISGLIDVVSKYNLFAMPILDEGMELVGNVVVNDIVYEFLKNRKRVS
jgi:magnesium transporter